MSPDTSNPITLHLTRKYYIGEDKLIWNDVLKRISISASRSDRENFVDIIPDHIRYAGSCVEYEFYTSASFRFWQFNFTSLSSIIAELEFYDKSGERIDAKAIKLFNKDKNEINQPSLMDNNPLIAAILQNQITLDMQLPTPISRIVVMARNDGNHIEPGDRYELLYRDMDEWISLGEKTATESFIEFEAVPSNALYLVAE